MVELALGPVSSTVHTYGLSIWSKHEVQSYPQLHNKFKASLGYLRRNGGGGGITLWF